ncbi:hypothetical protein [Bradyrhizobium embrapense]
MAPSTPLSGISVPVGHIGLQDGCGAIMDDSHETSPPYSQSADEEAPRARAVTAILAAY